MVLERIQNKLPDKKRRRVLPPAIQASASGRLIVMTEDELKKAKLDLAELLETMVVMKLNPHEEPERLDPECLNICEKCPHYFGGIRLCGPKGITLGLS